MKKFIDLEYEYVSPEQITDLWWHGHSILWLADYVAKKEQMTKKEAQRKVEQAIMDMLRDEPWKNQEEKL